MILRSKAPTFTRPNDTTQYAAGDLVGNSTTASAVVALEWKWSRSDLSRKQIAIRQGIINVSGAGAIASKAIRIHLFTVVPTFTSAGDNSAISTVVATGFANWIGALDIAAMQLVADGSFGVGGPLAGSEIIWDNLLAPSGETMSLFGFLEARGAYTPAAQETYSVTLAGLPVAE